MQQGHLVGPTRFLVQNCEETGTWGSGVNKLSSFHCFRVNVPVSPPMLDLLVFLASSFLLSPAPMRLPGMENVGTAGAIGATGLISAKAPAVLQSHRYLCIISVTVNTVEIESTPSLCISMKIVLASWAP